MDRWQGKVAVVTGASAGIGASVVKELVKRGIKVVGMARRENRVQEIRDSLPATQKALLYPLKCDVSNEDEVKKAFVWIDKNLGAPHILINNAGIARINSILSPDNSKDIRDVIDTNVMGVVWCTRECYNLMKKHNVNDGHVLIVNSVAGHRVPDFGPNFPPMNIYSPSKFAVTALTETYRLEFSKLGTQIKITSISPGAVSTEIFPKEFDEMKKKIPILQPEDISDAIIYALSTRPNVQVHEIIIRPLGADLATAFKNIESK